MKYTTIQYNFLLLILFIAPGYVHSTSRTDSILSVLDKEIENRTIYYQKKEQTIAALKEQIAHFTNPAIRFDFCDKIYNEYLPYQFDSAFVYAGYSLELAREMNDKAAEAVTGCNLLHCYISAGLFKESCDILTQINIGPATAETKHLISEAEFKKMKQTAILINAARGSLVDEKALIEALHNGDIYAAGLDVYENEPKISPELFDLENVVLTPHAGTKTLAARLDMQREVAKNIIGFFEGKKRSRVN